MILDATAGNRTMWINKESDNIIYIDMETQLERPPNIFCKNDITPFRDKTFDTIFYDPPHSWGNIGHYHTYPRRTKEYFEKWHDTAIPRYYGWDKYKSATELVLHIVKAQEEFGRILKDEGLLWLKWNEMSISLYRILSLLNSWQLLLKLYITDPSQTAGKHKTYWLCMEKHKEKGSQLSL